MILAGQLAGKEDVQRFYAEAEAAADVRVRIPIAPEVDSLNVAVAVGIALHRLCDAFSGRA